MQQERKILPIQGVIQNYDWGGTAYISRLTGVENPDKRPQAELWMGVHPRGAACLPDHPEALTLGQLIARQPVTYLGPAIDQRFAHTLPYLFKVLDVARMLSIQVHPTKSAAEAGFLRENRMGIPLGARDRNYKDANHKPEVMVALSDFWLLHGFKPVDEIIETLAAVPEFKALRDRFADESIFSLYRYLMELPQQEVDRILQPLAQRFSQTPIEKLPQDTPDYWAAEAFRDYTIDGHFDRGIFSIYLLNLVQLPPGRGIFQAAGVPHAYLRGINVELMANSDNVFRGGLTSKHVDVPELLKNLRFEPVVPDILEGRPGLPYETIFPTPAPDFALSRIELPAGKQYPIRSAYGPSIFILLEGAITVASKDDCLAVGKGGQFFVGHGANYTLMADEDTLLYQASVPI